MLESSKIVKFNENRHKTQNPTNSVPPLFAGLNTNLDLELVPLAQTPYGAYFSKLTSYKLRVYRHGKLFSYVKEKHALRYVG